MKKEMQEKSASTAIFVGGRYGTRAMTIYDETLSRQEGNIPYSATVDSPFNLQTVASGRSFMLIAGGEGSAGLYSQTAQTFGVNADLTVTKAKDLTYPVFSAMGIEFSNCLVIAGGRYYNSSNDYEVRNRVVRYDSDALTQITGSITLSYSKCESGIAQIGGHCLMLGGYASSFSRTATVNALSDTFTKKTMASLTASVGSAGGASTDKHAIFLANNNSNTGNAQIIAYDENLTRTIVETSLLFSGGSTTFNGLAIFTGKDHATVTSVNDELTFENLALPFSTWSSRKATNIKDDLLLIGAGLLDGINTTEMSVLTYGY